MPSQSAGSVKRAGTSHIAIRMPTCNRAASWQLQAVAFCAGARYQSGLPPWWQCLWSGPQEPSEHASVTFFFLHVVGKGGRSRRLIGCGGLLRKGLYGCWCHVDVTPAPDSQASMPISSRGAHPTPRSGDIGDASPDGGLVSIFGQPSFPRLRTEEMPCNRLV
jgi:hypothetical protein